MSRRKKSSRTKKRGGTQKRVMLPAKGDSSISHSASLEDFRRKERDDARKRAAEILELASIHDLKDLLGRIIVWPLIVDPTPAASRNDGNPDEPVAEYVVCWLLSHANRWAGTTRPEITAHELNQLLSRAEQQIRRWSPDRKRAGKGEGEKEETVDATVRSARESLELLADAELVTSIGVRFPIEPVLWREYAASIYEPIAPELLENLGFNLDTLVKLRSVMSDRAQAHMDKHLGEVREFHKRANDTVKRLRRQRTPQGQLESRESELFAELARLSPTQSKLAIDWHATSRILHGSDRLVEVADDHTDLRKALGEGPLRALIAHCTIEPADLDPKHYELPNPSPELLFRPLVRFDKCNLLTNPLMVDYYADNIIWTAVSNPKVKELIADRRARFTVDKAGECFRSVFGSRAVHENLELYDPGTKRTVGEFDVLVVSSAGIVAAECKSARWSRSAKRGSVQRIRREMKELYFGPLEKLGDRLKQARMNPALILRTKAKQEVKVDWASSPRSIGIIVHLDSIDNLQASPATAPESTHESTADALLLCGLPYLETACQALRAPGVLLDYFLQRGRLSADKTAMTADENTWLALYLEDRLRFATFAEQGFTFGYLYADTAPLDEFVRSGFDLAKRPLLPMPSGMASVVESIDDHDLQFRVASVVMEQSDDNYARMESWAQHRGRTNPAAPQQNELFVIYSADGKRAVAMYLLSDSTRDTRNGSFVDRCRDLLASRVACTSCTMVVVRVRSGNLDARDAFELLGESEQRLAP